MLLRNVMTRIRPASLNAVSSARQSRAQGPQRTCLGCRTTQDAWRLLRLACTLQGQLILDATGHIPGRGGYVCYRSTCLQKALQPAKLALAFRQPVLPLGFDELHAATIQVLSTRLQRCLGMAQKAGAILSGQEALRYAIDQGTVHCLVLAEDAMQERVAAYQALCAVRHITCVRALPKDVLGACIGKAPRTALGIRTKHFGDLFCNTLQLLQQLQAS